MSDYYMVNGKKVYYDNAKKPSTVKNESVPKSSRQKFIEAYRKQVELRKTRTTERLARKSANLLSTLVTSAFKKKKENVKYQKQKVSRAYNRLEQQASQMPMKACPPLLYGRQPNNDQSNIPPMFK